MEKTMTPSKSTTAGQIDKAVACYRALLEKHAKDFEAETVQTVLGQPQLAEKQLAVFRQQVEVEAKIFRHSVAVDRNRTPKQALDASHRVQYTNRTVVNAMLCGQGGEVELVYFKPDPAAYRNGLLSCAALAAEYEKQGLVPDPQAQIDDNSANPAFADKTPNACQWQDEAGNWCYATFSVWHGGRSVHVYRYGDDWLGSWVFAGVRK